MGRVMDIMTSIFNQFTLFLFIKVANIVPVGISV